MLFSSSFGLILFRLEVNESCSCSFPVLLFIFMAKIEEEEGDADRAIPSKRLDILDVIGRTAVAVAVRNVVYYSIHHVVQSNLLGPLFSPQ